ncbi:hypothetical protein WN944_021858 [Citrus x changshan-huyou]|uniref:Uncharacterized protein n=1 Tax=Citrus x changshan-huyou TaxID=2935761 RepID=A0AAP0R2W8_9ROSI
MDIWRKFSKSAMNAHLTVAAKNQPPSLSLLPQFRSNDDDDVDDDEKDDRKRDDGGPPGTKVLRLLFVVGTRFICTAAINKWRELERKSLQRKEQESDLWPDDNSAIAFIVERPLRPWSEWWAAALTSIVRAAVQAPTKIGTNGMSTSQMNDYLFRLPSGELTSAYLL